MPACTKPKGWPISGSTDLLNGLQASVWEGRGVPIEEVTYVNQSAEGLFGYSAEVLKEPDASRRVILEEDHDRAMGQYAAGMTQWP